MGVLGKSGDWVPSTTDKSDDGVLELGVPSENGD